MIQRNSIGTAGGIVVLITVLVAILAPYIAPQDPNAMNIQCRLQPPSATFPLGTDSFGRDILVRLIYGARISLWVGILAVAIALTAGAWVGLIAGYYEGIIGMVLMRTMDVILSFPAILLALFVTAILGPNTTNAMLAIGIVFIPTFARLAQGSVLSEKRKEFVEAARTIGATDARIILFHIFPNVVTPLIVQATLSFSWAILTEAALSFLGLGTQPPTPSWGAMLSASRQFMLTAPWTAIFPGAAIMVTVLGFNLLGDTLRDILDPRLRTLMEA
ncbi:MAG: ABC transporter permease [Chloroflexi bacterium]|nr:ABC transporter permease [Chloroflexota bacterium]MCL5075180.1 ABC transporter permease [Chloroflexota bacterium]